MNGQLGTSLNFTFPHGVAAGALIGFATGMIFSSGAALSVLSQMGTVIIFCLSFNMLFGQGGMLSFGHAVYSGLGGFVAIHVMNMATNGNHPIPVTMIPLVGSG